MKIQLLSLVTLLTYTASYAAHIAPIRTMEIPMSGWCMTIDAEDDETMYSAEQSTDAFNPTGSSGADADFTFTFKLCYDSYFLFVFGKILDDYDSSIDSIGQANPWTYDNVELFLDLDTNGSGSSPAYDTNTIQLRFNRGVDSVSEPGRAPRSAYYYAWKNLADGWVFEAAVPWKAVLGPAQVPEDIMAYINVANGFDMAGADYDTDGADMRDCQTAWDNDEPQDAADRTEDNAWNNRTVFGIMSLVQYVTKSEPNDGSDNISHIKSTKTNATSFSICSNSINENKQPELIIYPNPVIDILNFENLHGLNSLEVINITGQHVLSAKIIDNQADLSLLSKGVYFAKVGRKMIKIIKQ